MMSPHSDAHGCSDGALCDSGSSDALCASGYTAMMACGGAQCPRATKLWDEVNHKMHAGMALKFSGDPELDFVRGMIPHHQGAVDMCDVLVKQLSCQEYSEDHTALQGILNFCHHVNHDQGIEMAGLRGWLHEKGFDEDSGSCAGGGMDHSSMGHRSECVSMQGMSMGCGADDQAENVLSTKAYMLLNQQAHQGMAIDLSCNHVADFVRAMIPHHTGAVGMCEILTTGNYDGGPMPGHGGHMRMPQKHTDPYLLELCGNITSAQNAEISMLTQWLQDRDMAVNAVCDCCEDPGSVTGLFENLSCESAGTDDHDAT